MGLSSTQIPSPAIDAVDSQEDVQDRTKHRRQPDQPDPADRGARIPFEEQYMPGCHQADTDVQDAENVGYVRRVVSEQGVTTSSSPGGFHGKGCRHRNYGGDEPVWFDREGLGFYSVQTALIRGPGTREHFPHGQRMVRR
jgi:hypothetical protein